jgi:hypothetical protein
VVAPFAADIADGSPPLDPISLLGLRVFVLTTEEVVKFSFWSARVSCASSDVSPDGEFPLSLQLRRNSS